MKPRSAKAKGTKLEKWVAAQLALLGVDECRRQPGSGIYSDFPHDVHFRLPGFGPFIAEAKCWKHGWRTGDRAKGKAHLLVIKRNFGEPCVYMSWDMFAGLVQAILEAQKEAA